MRIHRFLVSFSATLLLLIAGCGDTSPAPSDTAAKSSSATESQPQDEPSMFRVEYFQISEAWGKCKRVADTLRTICDEPKYIARFDYNWYAWWNETGKKRAAKYPFGPTLHGMVVMNDAGDVVAIRGGHHYGREEIVSDLDALLEGHEAPSMADLRERQSEEAAAEDDEESEDEN